MTTTYSLSTDIGKIRLLISDTSLTAAHFSDEELQVFLDMAGTVNLAAAQALEAWAASLSDSMTSESIGDYSYSKKSVSNKLELAKTLRQNDDNNPVMTWAEMDLLDMVGDEE